MKRKGRSVICTPKNDLFTVVLTPMGSPSLSWESRDYRQGHVTSAGQRPTGAGVKAQVRFSNRPFCLMVLDTWSDGGSQSPQPALLNACLREAFPGQSPGREPWGNNNPNAWGCLLPQHGLNRKKLGLLLSSIFQQLPQASACELMALSSRDRLCAAQGPRCRQLGRQWSIGPWRLPVCPAVLALPLPGATTLGSRSPMPEFPHL